jgi:hypothetical protein
VCWITRKVLPTELVGLSKSLLSHAERLRFPHASQRSQGIQVARRPLLGLEWNIMRNSPSSERRADPVPSDGCHEPLEGFQSQSLATH